MLKDINQIKALTLLVSSKIGNTSSDDLISALLASECADIADITDAFVFLTEDGFISLSDGGRSCVISEKGKAILPDLMSLFGAGVAEAALEKALRFSKGAEYTAEIKQTENGFLLSCRSFERNRLVCETNIFFDDENEAIHAKINFLKRPDAVMGAVKASVTGNVGYTYSIVDMAVSIPAIETSFDLFILLLFSQKLTVY